MLPLYLSGSDTAGNEPFAGPGQFWDSSPWPTSCRGRLLPVATSFKLVESGMGHASVSPCRIRVLSAGLGQVGPPDLAVGGLRKGGGKVAASAQPAGGS